jgi:hypothetical protein
LGGNIRIVQAKEIATLRPLKTQELGRIREWNLYFFGELCIPFTCPFTNWIVCSFVV